MTPTHALPLPLLLPLLLLLSVLLPLTHASSELSTPTNCAVKGAEGLYSYDPTSGSGPSVWGAMPDFHTCGEGHHQSPIDFPTNVRYAPLEDGPRPALGMAELELASVSYNWALNCPEHHDCGETVYKGKVFKLVNLHFHHPSEHRLDGKQFPLESHMVHASEDGELAVLATMYDYAPESYVTTIYEHDRKEFGTNKLLGSIIKHLYNGRSSFPVYMKSVIEPEKGYCTYVGSLTTPPCTEGVTFFMSNAVQTVSRRQVAKYALTSGAGFDGNNRPTQPMNDRNVTCYI